MVASPGRLPVPHGVPTLAAWYWMLPPLATNGDSLASQVTTAWVMIVPSARRMASSSTAMFCKAAGSPNGFGRLVSGARSPTVASPQAQSYTPAAVSRRVYWMVPSRVSVRSKTSKALADQP